MRITSSNTSFNCIFKGKWFHGHIGSCKLKPDIEKLKTLAVNFAFGEKGIPISYAQWAKEFVHRSGSKAHAVVLLGGRQLVAVAGQRTRKIPQMEEIWRKNYNRSYFKSIVQRLRSYFLGKRKELPFVAWLGAVAFHWENDDGTIERVSSEMNMVPSTGNSSVEKLDESLQKNRWEKSIDMPHLIGWRRPIADNSGLYEYKLYCRFEDVSARAFYQSQVDLNYRKTWDDRTVELDIIDRDEESDAEVLRWVSRFPWPMACREYILVRKAKIDYKRNTIVLIHHNVDHPDYPRQKNGGLVRVEHYTSDWVIRPHTTFDENGFDFILTYFDDPKGSYPSSVVKWVANQGVPGYVSCMHAAAKKYQESHCITARSSPTQFHSNHSPQAAMQS